MLRLQGDARVAAVGVVVAAARVPLKPLRQADEVRRVGPQLGHDRLQVVEELRGGVEGGHGLARQRQDPAQGVEQVVAAARAGARSRAGRDHRARARPAIGRRRWSVSVSGRAAGPRLADKGAQVAERAAQVDERRVRPPQGRRAAGRAPSRAPRFGRRSALVAARALAVSCSRSAGARRERGGHIGGLAQEAPRATRSSCASSRASAAPWDSGRLSARSRGVGLGGGVLPSKISGALAHQRAHVALRPLSQSRVSTWSVSTRASRLVGLDLAAVRDLGSRRRAPARVRCSGRRRSPASRRGSPRWCRGAAARSSSSGSISTSTRARKSSVRSIDLTVPMGTPPTFTSLPLTSWLALSK